MGRRRSVEVRFREQVKRHRERCGWSQSDLAKRLQDNGLEHIIPSTVAKIEGGARSVRIDEANVLADLFETSVDALLGRAVLEDADDVANEVRLARHTALKAQLEIQTSQTSLSDTALALKVVAGWQPEGDAEALVDGCTRAASALAKADRILTEALSAAGGLAR
jgi:transcriptional regulator with XRE-family HTH domain